MVAQLPEQDFIELESQTIWKKQPKILRFLGNLTSDGNVLIKIQIIELS